MKLLSVLAIVLGELGIGTALFVALQKTGEIRKSFFTFMALLVASSFALICLALYGAHFYRSSCFSAAVFALLAWRSFDSEKYRSGKIFLLVSAALAGLFLFQHVSPRYGNGWLALANVGAGTLLFGWSNGSMILGHWYLLMRGLSFGHFQRATAQLLFLTVLRAIGLVLALMWIFASPMVQNGTLAVPTADSLFFYSRVVWGLVMPGILGFMAWRCALRCSNQAGTGLLYIAEVSVLIGEIMAGYLGFSGNAFLKGDC